MTMRGDMAGLYVDDVRYSDPSTYWSIINAVPASGETDVAEGSSVYFVVASLVSAVVASADIYILRSSVGALEPVYIAGVFQAGYSGSVTKRASVGSGIVDEWVFQITPGTAFSSQETITVYIEGSVTGYGAFPTQYSFTIEDTTAPQLSEILWLTPRLARVKFNEVVSALTTAGGSAYIFSTRGNVSVVSTTEVEVRDSSLSSAMVGYWACLDGSVFPNNNGYRPILSVNTTTKRLTLDTSSTYGGPLTADDGLDVDEQGNTVRERDLGFTVSPWYLAPRLDEEGSSDPESSAERIQCAALPRVDSVEAVLQSELPSDEDADQYIYLRFFDHISINRLYTLRGDKIKDSKGNSMSGSTLDFQTPAFGIPANRLQFWQEGMLSPVDMVEDLENEGVLRKLSVVLQDTANILWYTLDRMQYLDDPYNCPEEAIDHLLYDEANPFKFSLPTTAIKRKLAWCLKSEDVNFYSRVGTPEGIEDFLSCFLGIDFTISPYLHADIWTIGDSSLGVLDFSTILGPSTAYGMNSYEVISPVDLTSWEREVVIAVCTWADPIDMHLIRIIEPSTSSPTGTSPISSYWVIGSSVLGFSTKLGG